ncbi:ADP-ribose glycohydrolase MACROD1 isoform X2 [Gasterosteus aculeatus]|uniref:ADP-ribose glycohydrolase MACROD1 isoform X2 n=1 Tax=Gasterosteus aculeatus aculeatus TaxID=481459 RepID=UPI0000E3E321|nr:ADP-ribose glycohydrolase MACROD1 isoform X2 [Gasterosteus aculeatus aculeatus]
MALRMSSLFSHVRAALSRVRADRCDRFKHGLTPGSLQLGARPATGPVRGHVKAALRAERSSPGDGGPPALSPGRRGWPGRVAFGAAAVLGASTVALVRSLHAGKVTATARKVDLNSADGDWRKTKEYLLSLSVMDRRQHYRTSDFVPLKDVSLWTPPAGASEQTLYPRNEKLDQKISLYSGDITKLEVDAIVNAANKTLLGGGGVDGAIHRAAGPMLKQECASLHGCDTGEAKITCGYGLPAKYVIHTVGPVARGGVGQEEKNALRSCYEKSLTAATEGAARSVAFPCISTGVYGYPAEQAVHEALAAVREYLGEHHGELDRVIFCVFLPADKELYLQTLPLYFPAAATVKSKL